MKNLTLNLHHLLALLAGLVLLSGCSTVPTIPPDRIYSYNGSDGESASLTGYELFNLVVFVGPKVWVSTIDGKIVKEGMDNPNETYKILPGERIVVAGVRASASLWGSVNITFNAQPQKKYRVNYGTPKNGLGLPSGEMYVWVEELETRQKVTEDFNVSWRPVQYQTPIYIPMPVPRR